MADKEKIQTSAKKEIFKPNQTYIAQFRVNETGLIVSFPPHVTEYLKLKRGNDLFFVMINGIVQISSHEPKATIPVLDANGEEDFIPKKDVEPIPIEEEFEPDFEIENENVD